MRWLQQYCYMLEYCYVLVTAILLHAGILLRAGYSNIVTSWFSNTVTRWNIVTRRLQLDTKGSLASGSFKTKSRLLGKHRHKCTFTLQSDRAVQLFKLVAISHLRQDIKIRDCYSDLLTLLSSAGQRVFPYYSSPVNQTSAAAISTSFTRQRKKK